MLQLRTTFEYRFQYGVPFAFVGIGDTPYSFSADFQFDDAVPPYFTRFRTVLCTADIRKQTHFSFRYDAVFVYARRTQRRSFADGDFRCKQCDGAEHPLKIKSQIDEGAEKHDKGSAHDDAGGKFGRTRPR